MCRSRIGVIPQEPFIFSGSIRENVDPLKQYLDAEIWRALQACGLRDTVVASGGLSIPAGDMSRGRAQLLCLTRAVLQRAKVNGIQSQTHIINNPLYILLQGTGLLSSRSYNVKKEGKKLLKRVISWFSAFSSTFCSMAH